MRRRRREHSLLLKASKILVSLGASVNLTPSHQRRALRSFSTPEARGGGIQWLGNPVLSMCKMCPSSASLWVARRAVSITEKPARELWGILANCDAFHTLGAAKDYPNRDSTVPRSGSTQIS
jgi:hypothetical protein